MHKRAELFLKDWALQHVGRGVPLHASDPETDIIVARLLRAARNAGIPEAALSELTVLRSLVIGVRALANGAHYAVVTARQPSGRSCTVTGATGTVGQSAPMLVIDCLSAGSGRMRINEIGPASIFFGV